MPRYRTINGKKTISGLLCALRPDEARPDPAQASGASCFFCFLFFLLKARLMAGRSSRASIRKRKAPRRPAIWAGGWGWVPALNGWWRVGTRASEEFKRRQGTGLCEVCIIEEMVLNEMTKSALDAATSAIGDGPVTMMNLLWFRSEVAYEGDFTGAQPDPQSAFYKGYSVAFFKIVQELGVEGVEAVYVSHRAAGLVAASDDDWDDLVVVRFRSFADFRKIVESEQYAQRAKPHHHAAIANWRLIATTQ